MLCLLIAKVILFTTLLQVKSRTFLHALFFNMPFQVHNINNQSTFSTQKDEPILQAALRAGHLYPYGCQAGACGACKSKLVSGKVEHLTRNPMVLSDQELAAGWCLTCQAIPQENIEIDVKEISQIKSIEIKTLPTRIREKNLLNDDVVQLFLSIPNTQNFDYLPGQYINILLKNGISRSFSIANTPKASAQNGLELHIRVLEDGHFSPQAKNSLSVKDILRIEGPMGTFFLRKENDKPIILVAGGTGFAPIKALVEEVIETNIKTPITLFWGARAQADLYLDQLAKHWEETIDNFTYIPVLSDLKTGHDWPGETGFIHDTVIAQHTDLSGHLIYAAGPPIMIDSLSNSLTKINFNLDDLFTDCFDYAAASD